MNVGIQVFTFDPTRGVLKLLLFLNALLKDSEKIRLVWVEHDGARRTATIGTLIGPDNQQTKLNECYAQVSPKHISPELSHIAVRNLIVHLSVSPSCAVWAKSADTIASGKPSTRKVIGYVQSLERAASFRGPALMPTVLEITLGCDLADVSALVNHASEIVGRGWPLIEGIEKFGVVDVGGEWLFFPKSGYNPNISDIHVYYSQEAQNDWRAWRARHNISFDSIVSRKDGESAMLTHSMEERRPAG